MNMISNRSITGYSAILFPFTVEGDIDWESFRAHIAHAAHAGLIPAVNMDTGYVNLVDEKTREDVLRHTQDVLCERSCSAGGSVSSQAGASFDAGACSRQIELIQSYGGIPTIFQSFGLTRLPSDPFLNAYAHFGRVAPRFIAFELGTMFAPFAKIYDIATTDIPILQNILTQLYGFHPS